MKNYYEVLEISESASQEVIERVYKLFAKKYHPDLNPENPKEAEEKFKEITEAYEVLSNEEKRKLYDSKLNSLKQQEKESFAINQEKSSQYTNASNSQFTQNYSKTNDFHEGSNNKTGFENDLDLYNQITMLNMQKLQQEREYQIKKAYNDAYVEALKSMGIKVVYKKTLKEKLLAIRNVLLFLLIIAIAFLVAWQIPEVRMKFESVIDIFRNR